jgi:hypothetical protein
MEELIARFTENLLGRLTGPLHFRFLMQPAMAAILAIRAGIHDAREGRPPYFWAIFTERGRAKELLREGWKAVASIFTIAVCMDIVYQLVVLRWVYPLETIVVALALAVVPYVLLRGPVNRMAQAWKRPAAPPSSPSGVK